MSDYTMLVPDITGAQITPSTVYAGAKIKVSAIISEKTVTLYPEDRYSGEINAGEV